MSSIKEVFNDKKTLFKVQFKTDKIVWKKQTRKTKISMFRLQKKLLYGKKYTIKNTKNNIGLNSG